jgi:hypothetical protein
MKETIHHRQNSEELAINPVVLEVKKMDDDVFGGRTDTP